ncbi:MAG: hypothetical protein WD030_02440 [Pirellulales bacterium]
MESSDSHGGYRGEGSRYLIFQTSPNLLVEWRESDPPWELPTWQQGPVPDEITLFLKIGAELSSSEIWYIARQKDALNDTWGSGEILAINPKTGIVWFVSWDT